MSPEHHKDIAHWLTRPGSTLTKPAVTAFVPLQLGFNGGQPAGWPYPITPDDVHGVEAALHAPVQQAGRADVLFIWNWGIRVSPSEVGQPCRCRAGDLGQPFTEGSSKV
jgi:hypothetical protein